MLSSLSYAYIFLAVLAAVEIFYALRTGQVGFLAFRKRHDRGAKPILYWTLIAFWAAFILLCIYEIANP